jgi:hypothetical protein
MGQLAPVEPPSIVSRELVDRLYVDPFPSRKLSNEASIPIWKLAPNLGVFSSSETFFWTSATTKRSLTSSTRIGWS